MTFSKFKLQIKKYWIKILSFIVLVYLSRLLNSFFDTIDSIFLNKLISFFTIKIPIYSLLFGLLSVWFFYAFYRKIKYSHNKLKILKATYGKNGKYIDITNELNNAVDDDKLKIVLSNAIAGDPIVRTHKEGVINYEHNGKTSDRTYKEGEVIELPEIQK